MSHSLRAKLSGLRYKGLLIDKDYQRLKNALDVVDGLQDAIAEIETDLSWYCFDDWGNMTTEWKVIKDIIYKYTGIGEKQ